MEDINKRFRHLREVCDKTQEEWASIIGIARTGISLIESGQRSVTEKHIKLLCAEPINGKMVNGEYLRTGEGNMFRELPEEDEVAAYVSELLEDDGNNPLYTIIKEIMRTYSELTPKSQEVLCDFSEKLIKNLKEKEG